MGFTSRPDGPCAEIEKGDRRKCSKGLYKSPKKFLSLVISSHPQTDASCAYRTRIFRPYIKSVSKSIISSSGIERSPFDTKINTIQVVIEMVIEEGVSLINSDIFDDYENIRRRLKGAFAYFNAKSECWRTIPEMADSICSCDTILLRYKGSKKLARQTIQLPSPLALTKGILYLWGLIAGSTIQRRNSGICLDANQGPIVQAFADELGLTLKMVAVRRHRQQYGAEHVVPNSYRKIKVTFPSIFLKFLQCLGYCPEDPSIPSWFSPSHRREWLEGYLNSSKLQCQIQKHESISPKLTLYASEPLFGEIPEVLDHLGIGYYTYQYKGRNQIIIQRRASLERLTQEFAIRRPKVCALLALLKKFQREPIIRLGLRKFRLTEFQLTLYGVALGARSKELEYTAFERIFACSSNTIRQNLYYFDKIGLVSYYEKENHKEFFTLSNRYLARIEAIMQKEEAQLEMQLKYTDSNALSFHCKSCERIVGYAEAIGDHTFECPECHSKELQPLEISRCFYYGHLGALAHYQKVLVGALG